jgi:hypothetical protein
MTYFVKILGGVEPPIYCPVKDKPRTTDCYHQYPTQIYYKYFKCK